MTYAGVEKLYYHDCTRSVVRGKLKIEVNVPTFPEVCKLLRQTESAKANWNNHTTSGHISGTSNVRGRRVRQ